jgi:hypothetical protein
MADTAGTTRAPIGAILAIVGGALLAVGSFLAWAEVSGGGTSVTAKGVDGTDGYITLIAGIVALGVGLAMTRRSKRVFAILALLAGLIGGGVGLYDALTAEDSVLYTAAEEIAPTLGASVDEVRTLLDQAIDSGELAISISLGLYVVIGGGVLALLGGIVSMRGGTAEQRQPGSPRRRANDGRGAADVRRDRPGTRDAAPDTAYRPTRGTRRGRPSRIGLCLDEPPSRPRSPWRAVLPRGWVHSSRGSSSPPARSASRRPASRAGRARRP